MPGSFDKGQLVRVTGQFQNSSGTFVDPTTVTFRYKIPGGATTVLTHGTDAALVKDSVGVYHVDVDANAVGTWYYAFRGTGANQASDEDYFVVNPSQF